MNEISVQVSGLEALQRNLARMTPTLTVQVGKALDATALDCQTDARKLCPVGTPESTHKKGYRGGRLRASIRVRVVAELIREVFTDVLYAWWVENGTRRMRAKPYLGPAFRLNQLKLIDRFSKIFAQGLMK